MSSQDAAANERATVLQLVEKNKQLEEQQLNMDAYFEQSTCFFDQQEAELLQLQGEKAVSSPDTSTCMQAILQ